MAITDEGLIPWLLRSILGRSWATTIGGLIVGAPMIVPELEKYLDGDPSTNPSWPLMISGVGAVLLGRVARTTWVSSEQEGIKPAENSGAPSAPNGSKP